MVKVLFLALLMASGATAAKAETCIASIYRSGDSGGNRGATGQRLSDSAFTAAHKTFSFGSKHTVTNLYNGHSVTVTINDRGPFVHGRCVDLRPAPAKAIGCNELCKVRID